MENKTTLLDELFSSNEIEIELENLSICENINPENFSKILTDFSQPLIQRIKAINFYYSYKNNEVIEVLKRLISIYSFSFSSLLKEYLVEICLHAKIPFEFRLETCKDLATIKEDDEKVFEALSELCSCFNNFNITTTIKVESICILMRNKKFQKQSLYYLFQILDDLSLENVYRYKIINSLKTTFDLRKTWANKEEKEIIENDRKFFQKESFEHFLANKKNASNFRILAAQALLVNFSENNINKKEILSSLLEMSENYLHNDYNTRADATDVVLRYGDEKEKRFAQGIIATLGRHGQKDVKNIYQNAQNAHTKEIEESAIKSLEYLTQLPLTKIDNDKFIDFEYVYNKLLNKHGENVNITLCRISLDNALYGKLSISLKNALTLVYSYILTHEYKDVLLERLIEELSESANICSTGILERIVNTLSAFSENLGLRISVEDQIIANFGGRLNKRIQDLSEQHCLHKNNKKFCTCLQDMCEESKEYITKIFSNKNGKLKPCGKCIGCVQRDKIKKIDNQVNIDDLECIHKCESTNKCECECDFNFSLMDILLEQMMIPSKHYEKRITFLKFLRFHLSDILEELREEFKSLTDIPTFDMHFRRALIAYEGEN